MSFFNVETTFVTKLKTLCAILAINCLLTGIVMGQSRTPTDGYTPTSMEVGAPVGSYPLSDIEDINLYNGYLNIGLPLYQIKGRGQAGFTIKARIASTAWEIRKDSVPIDAETVDQVLTPVVRFGGTGVNYTPFHVSGVRTTDTGLLQAPDCNGRSQPEATLTRLKVTTDDGTEIPLIDEKFQGAPQRNELCASNPPANRGRVFRTRDGGSMTFISDTDISDFIYVGFHHEFLVSGMLFTKDGTRYRIENGSVRWLSDRNGNKITFEYYPNTFQVSRIIDSLNRQVTITHASQGGGCDVLSSKGFGNQERVVKVCYAAMSTVLRPGFTVKTGAELFPEINFNFYPPPYNDASWRHNPVVISHVELPDNRKYQFFYNSYGEVARVILPIGGGYDYDYIPSGFVIPGTSTPGNLVVQMVYRRLTKKTIYNALTPTTDPASPPAGTVEKRVKMSVAEGSSNYPGIPATIVTVQEENSGGELQAQSKHYSYGSVIFEGGAMCSTLDYSLWYSGREYRTETYDVVNGVAGAVLREVDTNWFPALPSIYRVCSSDVMNPIVPPDPKVADTVTTIDSNKVSKTAFGYDQYNNQTDIYEYNYGVGAPGALARHTHSDYLKSGYDTIAGGINNPNPTATIHIRNLPISQTIRDGSLARMAETTYEYDNYGADQFHAQLIARQGITGLCDGSSQNCPNAPNFSDPNYTTRGNVTKTSRWLNTTGGAINSYQQYDVVGNVVKTIDANGSPTTFDFSDCFGMPDDDSRQNAPPAELSGQMTYALVTKITNAAQHNAYLQYDYHLARPVNSEDANGVVSSVEYNDDLDRPTQGIQARYVIGVGVPAVRRQTTITYDDANRMVMTSSDRDAFNDNRLTGKSYYDGLGRTWRNAAYEGSTWAITDTQYDAFGRVSQVSNPYRAADPDTASPPSGPWAEWTITDYDALGRVIRVTTPDDAHIDTVYSGNQVTVTDQAGKRRRSETDALGRMTRVTEDPDGLNYDTFYSYDALGNLLQVTQGAQTRTFVYDSLSRLTTATNPENGTISYAYDASGNLTEKTDDRRVRTTLTYDALNRVRSKGYVGITSGGTAAANATPPVNYFYDDYTGMPSGAPSFPGTPSKGRLTGVTYGPGSEGAYYKYDAAGRVVTNHQRLGASNYVTTYSYNRAGAVIQENRGNPARRRNWFFYDAAGRLVTVQTGIFNANGFSPHDLVRDISYTPFGGVQSETYGNELIHSMAYNERLQPIEIRLGRPENLESVFRIGYIFGTANNVNIQDAEIALAQNNGNVGRIKYLISGVVQYTQTFQYDPLNRLSYAVEHDNGTYNDGARAWYQTFNYDPYGNRGINHANTSDNVDGANTALQLADFSAVNNRISRPGFTYDAAGNLTAEPGKSYTYDAENRLVTSTVGGVLMSQYFYDGNGRRVKKIVGGVGTRFEYGAGGELIAEWNDVDSGRVVQKDYFYKGGELIAASKVGNNGQYEHATEDHLGSPRAWTDDSGNLIAGGRHDYLPFGEELFAGVGTRTSGQGYAVSAQQDGQRKQFGAHERDTETGLDYFGARYFASLQGRFTSVDPLLRSGNPIEPQSWNRYSYVDNNPLIYTDPDGQIKRSFFGRIVFKKEGPPTRAGHGGAPGTAFKVQRGYVIADDGTRIEAFKSFDKSARVSIDKDGNVSLGPDRKDTRMKCDCHGLTFVEGKYWIDDDQVDKLLRGDNYQRTDTPKIGDLAIYRNADGEVVHSATVSQTDSDGNVTEVAGLGGIQPAAHSDNPKPGPSGAWHDPNATVEYYTKPDDKRSDKQRKNDVEKIKKFKKGE
jgi:RHS repeat-associated protein